MQLAGIPLEQVPAHFWVLTAAVGLTAGLMATDAVLFRLPNVGVLVLALLYPIWVLLHPEPSVEWGWALFIGLVALAIGMGLFALGLIGAGDAKFAAVAFMWAGPQAAFAYFAFFCLIGGVMSIALLTLRPLLDPWSKHLPRLLRRREPVAYGLALGGALLLVWSLGFAY